MKNTANGYQQYSLPIVADVKLFLVITTNNSQKLRRVVVVSPVKQIVRMPTMCLSLCLASQHIIWTNQLQAK